MAEAEKGDLLVRPSPPGCEELTALVVRVHGDGRSQKRAWVSATALAGAICGFLGLGYLIAGGGNTLIVSIVAAAPALLALLVADVRSAEAAGSSRLLVAVAASLPLMMLFVRTARAVAIAQLLFALAAVVLFASAQTDRRSMWMDSTRHVRLFGAVFGLALVLSYVASGVSGLSDAVYLASLLLAAAFFAMPVLIVDGLDRFEWLVGVLVAVGAIQVLVVAAQAAGLADALPGALSALDTAPIGGPLGTGTSARFTGTFGDFELLAEYASLVTLLGVGMASVSLRKSLRALGVVCSAAAVVIGLLTGTRGYVLSVAIGLGVLVLLLQAHRLRGRSAPMARVAGVAGLLVLAVYTVVPEVVRVTMFSRLATMEFTGPNAFNRAPLFEAWTQLAMRSPFLGYGAHMVDTMRAGFSAFVVASPHSLYFWVLLTAGIVGLVPFLLLIGALLLAQVRVYRAGVGSYRAWAAVFIGVLVAWLANEFKIDCVRSPFYVDWLVFVMGMPLALFAAKPARTLGNVR